MLVIKYANRKLYSKTKHRYVTLKELGEYAKEAESVTVIDNKTKNDITAETLAQYIALKARNLNQVTRFIKEMQ